MDRAINVISLALSFGGLVPALAEPDLIKRVVLTAVFGILAALFVSSLVSKLRYERWVRRYQKQILASVAEGPKPFEQIFDEMYYPDFATANDALDRLVHAERLDHTKVWATRDGRDYAVRLYSRPSIGESKEELGSRAAGAAAMQLPAAPAPAPAAGSAAATRGA